MRSTAFTTVFLTCLFTLAQTPSTAHPDDPPQKNEKKEVSKSKPKFTISKETTYVLGPVGPDGFIDYVQALNELCCKGVTVENNAYIPLVRAVGPRLYSDLHVEYCKRLGIPTLSKQDDQFITWDKFFKVPSGDESAWDKNYAFQQRVSMRSWSAAEFPKVADWIKVNAKAAELALEASHRTRYYTPYLLPLNGKSPLDRSMFGLILLGPEECRWFGDLLLTQAMQLIGEGRVEDAQVSQAEFLF